jgi:4-carboxymuconolactone decarboxylase
VTARIPPIGPPVPPDLRAALDKWMPSGTGAPPLAVLRTLARHGDLFERMRPLAAFLLGHGRLPSRVRELLVLRTCARTGAESQWGVHVTAFAEAVGLDDAAVGATVAAAPAGPDADLLRFADELHDGATVSDATWAALATRFEPEDLLEMIALVGFYHLIAFLENGAKVAPDAWAARFPR